MNLYLTSCIDSIQLLFLQFKTVLDRGMSSSSPPMLLLLTHGKILPPHFLLVCTSAISCMSANRVRINTYRFEAFPCDAMLMFSGLPLARARAIMSIGRRHFVFPVCKFVRLIHWAMPSKMKSHTQIFNRFNNSEDKFRSPLVWQRHVQGRK